MMERGKEKVKEEREGKKVREGSLPLAFHC